MGFELLSCVCDCVDMEFCQIESLFLFVAIYLTAFDYLKRTKKISLAFVSSLVIYFS